MAFYDFECKKCKHIYEDLVPYDDTDKYPTVVCPKCKSKKKTKLISVPRDIIFAQPEGCDKWNNGSTGHDYRFKHNIPKVKNERAAAQQMSHMGANPYGVTNEEIAKDINLDIGVHDAESRKGLS